MQKAVKPKRRSLLLSPNHVEPQGYNSTEDPHLPPWLSPTHPNWCWPDSKLQPPPIDVQHSNQGLHSRNLRIRSQNSKYRHSTTGSHRFPLNNFKYFLTLFSKFFSSFPHGTCSLSVSRQYLALDETYHPIRAAFPNNSTLWTCVVRGELRSRTGFSPSLIPYFKRLPSRSHADYTSKDYNSEHRLDDRFSTWAFPASLAVTKGIIVSFFSSPY